MRRRLRERAESRSRQSFGWSSAAERRNADLFWNDLLGRRPALRSRQDRGLSGESAEFRQPVAESSLAEEPFESYEADADHEDQSSLLGEAFGSDHVRVSLRNDDGSPAAGIAFRAQFRDGHIVNGTLDARGEATIADHTHGDVQVTFPALPASSWEVSSFGGSGD